MANLKDLSSVQLQKIISIKQQIEDLESELDAIAGDGPAPRRGRPPGRPKGRKMSAAGRRAISLAAKKRWAKFRGNGAGRIVKAAKKKRKMSAAARAKIAAAARARWKKAKAEGKTRL